MFGYAALCTFICSLLLILTHRRLDERARTEPLQDIISEFITPTPGPYEEWFKLCEMATGVYVVMLLSITAYRTDRAKLIARFFFTFGTLFLYRGFLMYMTLLPRPSKSLKCEYVIEDSQIIPDTITFWLSMGLSANGEHKYCGDYMYSGHTATILCLHLYILEYLPTVSTPGVFRSFFLTRFPWLIRFNHWKLLFKIPMTIFSTFAILSILITHNHYTIDVVIAYFFVTREFMIYHSCFKLGLQHTSTRVVKATPEKERERIADFTTAASSAQFTSTHQIVNSSAVYRESARHRHHVGIVVQTDSDDVDDIQEEIEEQEVTRNGYAEFRRSGRRESSIDKMHCLHGWWWPIFKWIEQDTW